MSQEFNYEQNFMGVMEGRSTTYLRTFKDDYRLKRLTEMLKVKRGRILDIGCGGGITTESLQYYYPLMQYFGCDVSKKAIDYAKKFGSGKVKYDIIKNKKLPYKDDFFDACICLDVMEHIPDADFFLKEVRRVLKKDGKFFLLVPCEGQPFTHTWISQKLKWGNKLTFKRYGHIHPEFTHKSVENLLKKHGFRIKDKTYSEHFIFQILSLILYFFPLEIMDMILGKNAKKYSDSQVIESMFNKNKFDFLFIFRNMWLFTTRFLRYLTSWELDLMKNSPLTAWKLIVLVQVDKNK